MLCRANFMAGRIRIFAGKVFYIIFVAFVTAVLGISIFLLLTFILSLLSRINLLERQIASIESMISESEHKLHEVGTLIRQSASIAKKEK
jgi:cell division protein FtsL